MYPPIDYSEDTTKEQWARNYGAREVVGYLEKLKADQEKI